MRQAAAQDRQRLSGRPRQRAHLFLGDAHVEQTLLEGLVIDEIERDVGLAFDGVPPADDDRVLGLVEPGRSSLDLWR